MVFTSQADAAVDESGPTNSRSPVSKKSKRIPVSKASPVSKSSHLIRREAFSKSPLSPHLCLKERAKSEGSSSLGVMKDGPLVSEEAQGVESHENILMAEEAGLTMPQPQP